MPVSGVTSIKLLDLLSFDKLAHMLMFALQFWFIAIGLLKQYKFSYKRKRVSSIAFLLSVSYGGIIELIQGYLLSGRTMDIMDMIANIVGAIIGWILFKIFNRKRENQSV
jgi:glycopeptide antibiotics resistance protein